MSEPVSRLRAERVQAEFAAISGRVELLLREFGGNEQAKDLLRRALGALNEAALLDPSVEDVGPRRLGGPGERTQQWLVGAAPHMGRNRGPL